MTTTPVSRRTFVASAASALFVAPHASLFAERSRTGIRLTARPGKPKGTATPGLSPIGMPDTGRDGQLYIPTSLDPKKPAPMLLALHGATQNNEVMTGRLTSVADTLGAALLAPDSRGRTWDAIRGDFGDDPAFIDRALARTFDKCAVDPARIWLCGFSDGASYGLSLGLANGDLFSRVLAFSPGFVIPAERHGKPKIFVSHGRQDPILPIDRASRAIVPQLKREGYDVRYDEFEGGHRMPPEILTAATQWLAGK
jgi:phospholipase/carboxylesterase